MRSTRSSAAMASLAFATLFTFTSAFGQGDDGPADIPAPPPKVCEEVIATYGRVYFLIPNHPDETGRCVPNAPVTLAPTPKADCPDTPVTGMNGEAYFVPRFKRGSRCFFTDAVSTVAFPTNVPTPHEAAAAPVADPVEDPEPSRGEPSRGAPALAAAVQTGERPNVIAGSFGQLVITDASAEYVPIALRERFVTSCTDNSNLWLETLEIAEKANREAVELVARARHITQAMRRPADGEIARRFDGIVEEFAALSAEVKDGQSALYAPLAGLWNRRALKDYGAESCGALYEFATLADSRALAMRAMTSAIAEASFLNVLIEDGREAADRHWAYLNRLAGGVLSPPRVPSL